MSSLKCIYSITKLHAVYTVYYTAVLLCSEIAWSALWSLLLLLILLASSWLWYCLIVWERWIICWKLKKRQCPLGQMTPPAPISIRWWLQSEHNSYALDLECLSKFYQAKNNNKIWIKHTSAPQQDLQQFLSQLHISCFQWMIHWSKNLYLCNEEATATQYHNFKF